MCARRRVARSRSGLLALAVASAALPPLAVVAGRRASETIGPALDSNPAVGLSLAFTLGVTAGLMGVLVAIVAPRRSFLGSQLEAAPLRPFVAFVLVTCVPVVAAGAVATALGLAFLVPAVGADAAPAGAAGGWAGFALGAAAAEGALAARASPAGLAALLGVTGLWALGSIGAGAGRLLGPFGYLAAALNGEPAAFGPPLPALVATATLGLGLWALAASLRSAEPPGRTTVRALLPVPTRPATAALTTALKRNGRRPELRRHFVGVVAFAGGGGLLLGAVLPVDAAALVLFSGTLAVLGATAVPLAAAGLDEEAEWLWSAAPAPRKTLAAATTLAALVSGAGVAVVAVAPVVVWARPSGGPLLQLLAVAVFCLAAAALAGALVPWRADRPAEQLASLAAFAAVAGGLWLALSYVATAVPGTGPAAALLAAETALAVAVSAALAGRAARC